MKKGISLFMVLGILAALLAGCGAKSAKAVSTDGSTSMERSSARWARPSCSKTTA